MYSCRWGISFGVWYLLWLFLYLLWVYSCEFVGGVLGDADLCWLGCLSVGCRCVMFVMLFSRICGL